jgi:hypothetical protein
MRVGRRASTGGELCSPGRDRLGRRSRSPTPVCLDARSDRIRTSRPGQPPAKSLDVARLARGCGHGKLSLDGIDLRHPEPKQTRLATRPRGIAVDTTPARRRRPVVDPARSRRACCDDYRAYAAGQPRVDSGSGSRGNTVTTNTPSYSSMPSATAGRFARRMAPRTRRSSAAEVEGLVGCMARGGSSPLRRMTNAPLPAGFRRTRLESQGNGGRSARAAAAGARGGAAPPTHVASKAGRADAPADAREPTEAVAWRRRTARSRERCWGWPGFSSPDIGGLVRRRGHP